MAAMVQVDNTTHTAFIWRIGRHWHYVCVTCEARETIALSKHEAIHQIMQHHPYVWIYNNKLIKENTKAATQETLF